MKAILRSGVLALAIMALAVPANAGPLDDGVAAADRGDYATALSLWRPLAEQGNANAQYKLGDMYDNGLGSRGSFDAVSPLWGRLWRSCRGLPHLYPAPDSRHAGDRGYRNWSPSPE